MNDPELIKWLIANKILTKNKRLNPNVNKLMSVDTFDIIKHNTPYVNDDSLNSLRERIYCLVNNTKPPICSSCDTQLSFRVGGGKGKKYGKFCSSSCSSSSTSTQDKMKATNIENNGISNPFLDKQKIKKARVDKFGTHKISALPHIKQKIITTCNLKYGGHPQQNKKVRDKTRKTIKRLYGVNHPSELQLSIPALTLKHNNEELVDLLGKYNTYELGDMFNVSNGTIHRWGVSTDTFKNGIPRKSVSRWEHKMQDFLCSLNIEHNCGVKGLVGTQEIDIYIPSHNLAIEINGIYWHGELRNRPKQYHLGKTTALKNKGITLLHITDYEMDKKWDIVKSRVMYKLGMINNKIGARQTEVRKIDTGTAREFLNIHHIAGFCRASTYLGLFRNDELVTVGSFAQNRFTRTKELELIRFCSKIGLTVSGGLSKIAKYINQPFITYCDLRWGYGEGYTSSGFSLISQTPPNYRYFHVSAPHELYSRNIFQKHKLENKLTIFNASRTEWQNMVSNGYDRIWDCGNLKLQYTPRG